MAALKLELAALQSSNADKQAAAGGDEAAVKLALDGLEKERDFYFKKLRDIEVCVGNCVACACVSDVVCVCACVCVCVGVCCARAWESVPRACECVSCECVCVCVCV